MEKYREKKKLLHKSNKGVSLIALVVAIIVMIILAGIVMVSSDRTVGTATYAKFAHELSEIQDKVTIKRRENKLLGVDKKLMNTGFEKVELENPPADFDSFDETKMTGYWVKFDTINEKEIKTGREELSEDTVIFGKTDVYVYDAAGKVYYAKGWYDENEVLHYRVNTVEEGEGPEIVSINYVLNSDQTKAIVTVVANPIKGGNLTAKIGKNYGIEVSTNTFEIDVTQNGTATVSVSEEGSGVTTQNITISGIREVKDETPPKILSITGVDGKLVVKVTGVARDDESKITGYAFTKDEAEPTSWTSVEANSINPTYTATTDGLHTFWVKNASGLTNQRNYNVAIKRERYEITYEPNGGILGDVPRTQEKLEGLDTHLSSEIPTREDHAFLGWSTDLGTTTPEYQPNDVYSGNRNITLYAIWKEVIVPVERLTMESINTQIYTGSDIKPSPLVIDRGTELINGVHYDLTYTNNKNVGTATVTLTGKGKYRGTLTTTFEIIAATMTGVSSTGYTGTYDRAAHGITVSTSETSMGATVKYGTSAGSYNLTTSPTYTAVGEYTVYYQVTKANYNTITGSAVVKITAKESNSLTITIGTTSFVYDGTVKTPSVSITDGSVTLANGTDYTITNNNTADVGTKYATLTLQGNYSGSRIIEYTITNGVLSGITATGFSGTYNGAAHGASVTLSGNSAGATVKYGTSASSCTQTSSPTFTNIGENIVYYQVTKANYTTVTGSVTIKITAASMSGGVSSSGFSGTYDGAAHKITVSLSGAASGATIKYGTSSSSYTQTSSPTYTNVGTYTVYYQVTKANYATVTGSATVKITAASMSSGVSSSGFSGTYDRGAHGISVSLSGAASGATVKYGASSGSYTQTSSPTYSNVGTYTVYYQVTKANYTTVTGSKTVTINAKSASNFTITLNSTSYSYDGGAKTPTITVKDGSTTLTKGTDYTVSGSTSGTNAGSYIITITGKGNYNSSKNATFTINKIANTLSVTAKTGLKISGSAVQLVNVSGAQGTVYYKVGTQLTSSNYTSGSTSIPTAITAGTHVVYYYTPGNTNYNAKSGSVSVAVTAETYTVTYNANGGSGAPSAQTKTYGVNLTLSGTVPTRTSYSFVGWNTAANGSGTSYYQGATYATNASVTLYAQWKSWNVISNPISIGFDANREDDDESISRSGSYKVDVSNYGTLTFTCAESHVYGRENSIKVIGNDGTVILSKSNFGYSATYTIDVSKYSSVTFDLYGWGYSGDNSWKYVSFSCSVTEIILKPDVPLVDTNVYGISIDYNYDSSTGYFERTASHTVDVAAFKTLTFTSDAEAGNHEGGYGRGVSLTVTTNTGATIFSAINNDIDGTHTLDVSGYSSVTFNFWGSANPSDNSWYYVGYHVQVLEIRRGY